MCIDKRFSQEAFLSSKNFQTSKKNYVFIEFEGQIFLKKTYLFEFNGDSFCTWVSSDTKYKEAFSTLVECLYKWYTFISRIFLKIGWVTV